MSKTLTNTIIYRAILYILIISAGLFVLIGRPYIIAQVREDALSPTWLLGPSIAFAVVFLLFALDELQKAFLLKTKQFSKTFAMAFCFMAFAWTLPGSFREYKVRKTENISNLTFFSQMFAKKDARIRALVMYAASNEKNKKSFDILLKKGLNDPDPFVREAAKKAMDK